MNASETDKKALSHQGLGVDLERLQLPVKYCLHEKLIKIKYLVFFHSGFVMIFVIFHMPTQGKFYIFQL